MYSKYDTGPITLWCASKSTDEEGQGTHGRMAKCKKEETSSKCQDKENEVDDIYQDLKSRHGEKYSTPLLRLWARIITANLHENLDNPPNIPAFSNTVKKSCQHESFSDAIGGVAIAIVKAFGGETPKSNNPTLIQSCTPASAGLSPAKSVDLRMKNFEKASLSAAIV